MNCKHFVIGSLSVIGIFLSIYLFYKVITENFDGKVEYYNGFYWKLVNGNGLEPEETEVFRADIINLSLSVSIFVSSVLLLFGMIFVSNYNGFY